MSDLSILTNLPEFSLQRLALKVKPRGETMLRKGHPWLFESAIIKQNKPGNAGDMAIIYDKKNKFLAIGLYDPYSPIRVKILASKKQVQINASWFEVKIAAAYELRKPLLETDTSSYRLIHGENDGFPGLIADVYADVLVVKLYTPIWMPYLKTVLPILLKQSNCKCIVLRLSRNLQNLPELLHGLKDGSILYGKLDAEEIIFKEHGLLFSANVIHGHKTGYFLDHRHNRKRLGELAGGKTVLDVFSYAGGFTVHALAGGAKEVTSLDISKQALEMAKKNVALNFENVNHKTMAEDAFAGLQKLFDENKKFDIVVVDPPSFAKKDAEREKALHSYGRLAKLAVRLVKKNGVLLLASCSSRVSADEFFARVSGELRSCNRKITELEKSFHDVDHPVGFAEGGYLKSVYFGVG